MAALHLVLQGELGEHSGLRGRYRPDTRVRLDPFLIIIKMHYKMRIY